MATLVSIISTTVASTVDPGYSGYATGITITNTGGIIPSNGGPGISDYGVTAGAVIYNAGIILSATNYGIKHSGSATITNRGTIIGMGNPSDGIFVYGNAVIKNIGTNALINGNLYAVALAGGTATIVNQGHITGSGGGIDLQAGGFVTNSSAALIKAANAGITGAGGIVTVLNAGSITSNTETGVRFSNGGYLFNQGAAALVTGSRYGLTNYGDFGTLVNQGTVIGAVDSGFYASGLADSVTNASGAILEGGKYGLQSDTQTTLVNAGSVLGTGTGGSDAGVRIVSSGLVINQAGGVIASNYAGIAWQNGLDTLVNQGSINGGSGFGVKLSTGGTITNAGTIGGGAGAVLLGGLNPSALIIDPGAVFAGLVTASGTSAVLEFATLTGVKTGALDLGNSFSGFSNITFVAGASWSVEGAIGAFDTATIAGFTIGDTIVLDGFSVNPLDTSYVSGVGLALTSTAGTKITLDISGSFTTGNFNVVDPPGATTITVQEVVPLVSIISTAVTSTVQPGGGVYAKILTITNTGAIFSPIGIEDRTSIAGIGIQNYGTIFSNSGGAFGVQIDTAATVNNLGTGAVISDTFEGIYIYYGPGTVTNQGKISGKYGVQLRNGGVIVNSQNALISGATGIGVLINQFGPFSLTNAGTITGDVAAVQSGSAGYIANTGAAALIFGQDTGAMLFTAAQTVVNQGTIEGVVNSGINLEGGGLITNRATGLVAGGYAGIYTGLRSTVANYGTIRGLDHTNVSPVSGIDLESSGVVINTGPAAVISSAFYGIYAPSGAPSYVTVFNSGVISGGADFGIDLKEGGTIFSSGTIGGTKGAVYLGRLANDRVIVNPGAVFDGGVTISPQAFHSGLLELGSVSTANFGSLDMGGSFFGFGTIEFDAGAKWSLEGSIAAFDSQLITGFSFGDTIVLDNFVVNTLDTTYVSGTGLELTDTAGNHITLDFAGNFSTASFIVIDPPGTTTIEAVCYLRGTRIATPGGERPIESLAAGDAVVAKFGGYQRIKWIGRQSYDRRFIANNYEQIPVRICQGALGRGLPRRDLFVSPGHSMLIDGVLVLAKALVNGITIRQDECPEQVDYFQLEFEAHDCILAEGAWSESYADTPDWRDKFHNAAEFYALFPDHVPVTTQTLCAARPLAGPALARALRPVVTQAGFGLQPGRLRGYVDHADAVQVCGWAQDEAHPLLPVQLEIWAGGRMLGHVLACDERADLLSAGIGHGRCGYQFVLPAGCDGAELVVRRSNDKAVLPMAGRAQQAA